jgi:DNA-binding transcriptional LysR family regulator
VGNVEPAGRAGGFRHLHPLVTVRLRQSLTGSSGHLDEIADGKMDLALVAISSSPSRLIAIRELTEEPMVFVCEPTHPLAHRRRVQLADLAGQDFINFPRGWGIRQRIDAAFAAGRAHPTNAYEVADYAIAAELVRRRLATTVLPISAANRFPDLHTIPLNPPMTWALSLASSAAQTASRAVTALVDTITRHVDS